MGFDDDFNKVLVSRTLVSAMREAIAQVCGRLHISTDALARGPEPYVGRGDRRVDGAPQMIFREGETVLVASYVIKEGSYRTPITFDAKELNGTATVWCEGQIVYPECTDEALDGLKTLLSHNKNIFAQRR